MTLATVIIAALDADDVLGDQLDALAQQDDGTDFEVLVCDNGSHDRTQAVVQDHMDAVPGLRWIDASDQRGSGPARNAGVEEAQGDLILFCDADDIVEENWVSTISAALETSPVVAGRLEGETLNPKWCQIARPLPQDHGLQESGFLPHAAASNLGVRRSALRAVKGFDPRQRYLQDVDLCWRLQLAGYPLVFERRALVHVRLRQTLDGIFTQGRNYGRHLAMLEARYADQPGWKHDHEARGHPLSRRLSTGRRILSPALRHPGRGGWAAVLWQIGWHLGHRAGVAAYS